MVLISIDPFTFRKTLLIVVAFLGLSAFCFADPVLMAQRYTPNSERFDTSRTLTPGQQSQQPGKAGIVGPEFDKFELGDGVRGAAGWRLSESSTDLGLPPAVPAFGFSLRAIDVRSEIFD
jgi:hypothetical protein